MDKEQDLSGFDWFSDCFGYDKDSRKAERIYNLCIEMQDKINSLHIEKETSEYLSEEANQETDQFSQDIKTAIRHAKQI